MKNVYTPLAEISSAKKRQCKKLLTFRENFENILCSAGENVKEVSDPSGHTNVDPTLSHKLDLTFYPSWFGPDIEIRGRIHKDS